MVVSYVCTSNVLVLSSPTNNGPKSYESEREMVRVQIIWGNERLSCSVIYIWYTCAIQKDHNRICRYFLDLFLEVL